MSSSGAPLGVRPTGNSADLTPDGIPRMIRIRQGSVVGGVAAGVAAHLHARVLWVRVAFAVLAAMGGAGVLGYALLWMFMPADEDVGSAISPVERRQAVGIAAVGLALMVGVTALGFGPVLGWVLGPLGLAAVGAAFVWREADDARRARWRRTAAGMVAPSRAALWRILGGCVLVIGGLTVFALGQLAFSAVRAALVAVLLTLLGVAVITIPWWLTLVRDLGAERQGRIRERERAEIAAHLHDSVLQTLVLIQRQSADPREVQRLARSQERELRGWLYGPAGYAAPGAEYTAQGLTLGSALATAAGEVEDTYAVAVAPVMVGDAVMNRHLAALIAAAREAMVNAAKHSGAAEISVYAEVENGAASVFVRDRGKGFEPALVGADRKGLAESIKGRMERHGGKAIVRSRVGEGTEVELQIPIEPPANAESTGKDTR